MISTAYRFPAFMVVSLLLFLGVLRVSTRRRNLRPAWKQVSWVAGVVVIGGMVFAKVGQNAGIPWWICYGVPAGLTLILPPLILRFTGGELVAYLTLAFLSPVAIHAMFSMFLGWHEYLPFIRIPYLPLLNFEWTMRPEVARFPR